MRDFELRSARYLAADCLRRFLHNGDTVIDATMGNGHDTLLLCQLVGESGHVYAFDVQQQAMERTRSLLEAQLMLSRATLYCCGHENMASRVKAPVDAVVFNLGWLPGSDKQITTHWQTTKAAVEQALDLLKSGGLCVICVYPGHAAGDEERIELERMLSQLPPQQFNVLHQKFINAGTGAPECFILQKQ